jgi:predicted DNA binding CopG/RHH family protein
MAAVVMTDEKRVSIRLSVEDMARIKALALGDETLSQTVRRVLREASQATAPIKRKRK